jgi:acetolactate synthase-1/2/3 large subunit
MSTLADDIVRELRHAGVQALFGVPGGGSNLDLVAAAARADLPFVLTATETAGAIAALAQSEVAGAPGACLTTLGPGAASVVNGIACAFLDGAPVLVFTDTYGDHAVETFAHQRLDHASMFRPICKATARLSRPSALRTVVDAIEQATAGRPGPVHLDCPGDVLASPSNGADGDRQTRPRAFSPSSAAQCSPGFDVLLARAVRPLLLVGLGARRPADALAIRRLCARRGVPALVTYKAKGVVADDDPWFAGVFTHAAIERPLLRNADVLIGVGLDPVELLPRRWDYDQPVVCAGPWPADGRHVPCAETLVAPIPGVVDHLELALAESAWTLEDVRAARDAQRNQIRIPAGGLTAQRVVEIAAWRLARDSRVTVDAGAHMFPATMLWPVGEPNGMLISNGLSTMGFAVPAAIGAALTQRQRRVVVLTGDGGLLMCAGELATLARERLRVIVVVFNDASLSLIEIKQRARQLPAAGVAIGAIDWCALARSVGVEAWAAADERSLAAAIDEAAGCAGPALIDAKIDRSNYGDTLRAVRG